MSANYAPVLWNRQKRIYDLVMAGLMTTYCIVFAGLQLSMHPEITAETLIIRTTGTLAFLMLHWILCIGPLARINPRFLPLLYNRRHLGVTMCCVALVHGIFNVIQFHALGNVSPLISVFTSNPNYLSLGRFPFEVPGVFALLILMVMAATSHDFWLKNLTPVVWKSLHMLVYAAYALLIAHVLLGVIQLEKSPVLTGLIFCGMCIVIALHLIAAQKSKPANHNKKPVSHTPTGYHHVCHVDEIEDQRAKTILIGKENIAIFKYNETLSAVNNRCRHQSGPLGEGRIVDGCITCPWHGYQYLPHNGQSPPPFTEKVETYDVEMIEGEVYVNPTPYPEGTERPPCPVIRMSERVQKIQRHD